MIYDLWQRYKKQLILGVLIVGLMSFLLGIRRNNEPSRWNIFDKVIVGISSTVSGWTREITVGTRSLWGDYVAVVNAAKENDQLKLEIKELNAKIHTLNEIENENNRLRKLLNFSKRLQHKLLPAQVVAENLQGELRTIRLNKGSKDHVKKGAAVVTNDGVVGKVIRVDENFSDVLTIIDANSAIDSLDARTRARGIVEGRNIGRLNMKYLQRDDDVIPSDTIITSGLGEDYPKGILIGKVTHVDRKNFGISQDVLLEPSVDFTKIEEVFIVTGVL